MPANSPHAPPRRGSGGRGFFAAPATMYETPPQGDVAIEEFEKLAINRLQVLRAIDDGRVSQRSEHQIQERVRDQFNGLMKGDSVEDTLVKDVVSHYVLRLAFCQTEDLRRWFLSQECDLFTWRFNSMPPYERVPFLKNHFEYEEISSLEFQQLKHALAAVFTSVYDYNTAAAVMNEEYKMFYKVPFECVPELVAKRRVLLKKGFAFVPRDQVASLVVGHFRARLSKALTLLAHHWSSRIAPEERERLVPIVEALKTLYVGPDYCGEDGDGVAAVSAKQLPALAKRHFPLCMRHLFERLTEDHHLKHMGRQQLSLFLKGIGLPLGDSLQFWRQAFSPKIPSDKFEKEYAYNIRHNYGREGKRKDYMPYPCVRIVSMASGVGEHQGCPYKTFSEPQLRASLRRMQVTEQGRINEILSKAKGGHYQIACAASFEGVNHCPCDTGINHPNQYFDESRKVEMRKNMDGAGMDVDLPSTPMP